MYHKISSAENPVADPEEARYAVNMDEFSVQMKEVSRGGLRCETVRTFAEESPRERDSKSRIILTFDDGNRSDFMYALPVLEKLGLYATFFVCTDRIGVDDGPDESMLRSLCGAGMEIASHGVSHGFLTQMNEGMLRDEIRRSKDILSSITGEETTSFAPPGGRIDKRALCALREEGYKAVCTSRFGFNCADSDLFALKRIPITAGMTRRAFHGTVEANTSVILPMIMRSRALELLRTALGERIYRKIRSGALRNKPD